jgi:hypothetical protein
MGSPETLLDLLAELRATRERRAGADAARRRGFRRAMLGGAILVVALLLAFSAFVWLGVLRIPQFSGHPTPASHAKAAPRPPRAARSLPAPYVSTTPVQATRPAAFSFRLTATRGDCWVSIRSRSATGPVLYEGVLRQGETARVRGTRLWARFGAIGNLDLYVNGKPVREAHSGTLDAVVTAAGLG